MDWKYGMDNLENALNVKREQILQALKDLVLLIQENKLDEEKRLWMLTEYNKLNQSDKTWMDQEYTRWFKEIIEPKHKDKINKIKEIQNGRVKA
jgi:hypothetical protein